MDCNDVNLHPNWRALATIHLPLKRFIKEGQNSAGIVKEESRGSKYEIEAGDGRKVREFYEDLLKQDVESTHRNKTVHIDSTKTGFVSSFTPSRHRSRGSIPFDKNKFFRCAMENKASDLDCFLLLDGDINVRDNFGWTALMMAACEGAAEAAQTLLDLGADRHLKDNSKNTALNYAEIKGHTDIVHMLKSYEPQSSNVEKTESGTSTALRFQSFHCDICQCDFAETSSITHQTSTLHKFNAKSSIPFNKLQRFNIPSKNKGLQLMIKQGWDKESGLGPSQNGRLYPIKTVIRKRRTGIGVEQQPARVTHFEAFDVRATQRLLDCNRKKQKNRNDIRREKVRDWKKERRLRRELS